MPRCAQMGWRVIVVCVFATLMSCGTPLMPHSSTDDLRTAEGLAQWEKEERAMQEAMQTARDRYERDPSLDVLQDYEKSVRAYLDHGFLLYRHYRATRLEPPAGLIPSLEVRTGSLMDVADQYIHHGSLAMGEGIASDVVHDYSDLPALAPAQRRAEAMLLHHRYRQDY